ncbi:unnamed protein product [Phytophthora fragariaefolia]|uniref:Unnamed protein product n=1 Tax=Phytophthora fragariaefolia TaxID=1490495 RepID=A0A9W7CWU7_9STRA|nr:unnamed protein product [Phytophthora fragariaefolia]
MILHAVEIHRWVGFILTHPNKNPQPCSWGMSSFESLWPDSSRPSCGMDILPFPLSQPPDSDAVLCDFLQEMAELDQQPSATARRQADTKPKTVDTKPWKVDTKPWKVDTKPKKVDTKLKKADTKPKKATTKPKKAPVKPRETSNMAPATRWRRRKQELQRLKDQAETLGTYVSFLQARRVPGVLLADPVSLAPELDQLVEFQVGGWQAAAIREIRRCQEAQQENLELKQRLHACVQASGALQVALNAADTLRKEQLARDSIAAMALRVEASMSWQLKALENALIFDMLEAHVNARVSEVPTVAGEVSQPMQLVETDQVSICRKDESHAAVEFNTVRMLPFDIDTISSICWQVAGLGWNRQGARVVRRSRDVVASDWCFPEGCVVLAECTTEWPAYLEASGAWPRVTREHGWALVHSYPFTASRSAAQSPSRPTASMSRFLMSMTTEPSGLDIESSHKLLGSPAVSDVVIPFFRRLIKNRQQRVDNRLMDSAFAAPTIPAI